MRMRVVLVAAMAGVVCGIGAMRGHAQSDAREQAARPSIVETLRAEASKVEPLLESEAAKGFVRATSALPDPGARVVYRNRAKGLALNEAAFDTLPEAEREGFEKREYPAAFYYTTGYGTPLVYARPLDIVASMPEAKMESLAGKKILDFGYGTIGHLRLMAACGAEVHGVEIEPLFEALYSAPGDTGRIEGANGAPAGSVTIHTGQFPAGEEVTKAVAAGGPYDVIVSKNTLKRGYIHPEREADPRTLVHLGVDDETFVKTLHDNLKPGGIVMIYNICPPQAPPEEKYIPWADGRCPFDRELMESAGFEVLALDVDDAAKLHPIWMALGLNGKEDAEGLKKSIFAHYTVLRRKG